jgi:phosphoesterase RecJ-like protein
MRSSPKIVERILAGIRDSQTICVAGHVRPDGDCIGSQLGLTLALKDQGKDVVCWNEDTLPDKLAFLDPEKLLQPPRRSRQFDCVIATDCASFERLGKVGECIQDRKLFINIDHHESNTRYADLNWISDSEPSTGELIFTLLKAARWPITPGIADCLFTAISTDTGSFQYPTTRQATFTVAGELVERGADPTDFAGSLPTYPLAACNSCGTFYNKFHLTHDSRTAYFWLKQRDYTRTGAGRDDSKG